MIIRAWRTQDRLTITPTPGEAARVSHFTLGGVSCMDEVNSALRVNIVAGGGGGGGGGTSSSFGAAFPAFGTAAGYSDGTNMQGARVFDVDSGAGAEYVLGAVLRKSASGGSVELGTSTDPLRIDPTGTTTQPISGTVTANAGSGTFTVGDGGGSLTVDDGGSSLTIDGTVSISGAVDTELPAAAALADGTANPTAPAVGAFLHGFDGTDWERLRCDATTRRLEVEVENTPNVDVTDRTTRALGRVFIRNPFDTTNLGDATNPFIVNFGQSLGTTPLYGEDSPHFNQDAGIFILGVRNDTNATLTSANGDYGTIAVDLAGSPRVVGNLAHDAIDAGNPIKIGGKAARDPTTFTAVAANDRCDMSTDLFCRQHVVTHQHAEKLLGVYFAETGIQTVQAATHVITTSGSNFWALYNPTGSTITVRLRHVAYMCCHGSALVTVSFPRIMLNRVTFAGTPGGTVITPAKRKTADSANTGVLRTIFTATTSITDNGQIMAFLPVNALTAVGATSPGSQFWKPEAEEFVQLAPLEALVCWQSGAGTTSDTRKFVTSVCWEEYTT